MSDFSARKTTDIAVNPEARSKKLDETLEKLSAIRKEQEVSEKMPLPSISAKRVDVGSIKIDSANVSEEVEHIAQSSAVSRPSPQGHAKLGSSLKSSLRVTSAQPEKKQEEAKQAEAKKVEPTKDETKQPEKPVLSARVEIPQTPKRAKLVDEMFEGDAANEPVLMLSPRNGMPSMKGTKYKVISALGTIATVGWLGLSAYYVQANMGFGELFSQQPHILGGFLAGVLAPIALLWMILAHVQRGSDVNMYADALRAELQAMIFPSEERKQIIHKDIEALCSQAAELSNSSQTILNSIHRARVGLRNEIRDFSGLSKKTEFHIDRLADSLSERSKRLIDLTNQIEERTTSLDAKTLSGAKAWDEAATSILGRAGDIEEAMKKGAQQIVSAADEAEKMTGSINDKLGASFETLKQSVESVKAMTSNTVNSITQASQSIEDNRDALGEGAKQLADKAAEITDTLNSSVGAMQESVEALVGKSAGIDERLNERVESLSAVLNSMDDKISEIEGKGAEAANKLSEAVVSAVSGADNIGSSVRRALEIMSRTTSESTSQIEGLLAQTDEKVTSMNKSGQETVQKIENVLSRIDENREKVEQSSEIMQAQMEKLNASIQSQSEEIERVQDNLSKRVDAIQLSMSEPLEAMEQAVNNAREKHEAIEQTLAKRIEELNLASDKALENGSKIRESLRGQTQEMATLSGQLAGNAKSIQSIILGQKDKLSSNVAHSLSRLEDVGAALTAQSEKLDEISKGAENNVIRLEGRISGQCNNIHADTSKIVQDLAQLDEVMSEKIKTLMSQANEASRSVEGMTSTLVSSTDMIEPVYSRAIEQIDATQARFDKLSKGFEEDTSSNLEKLKSMGILFDERLQSLSRGAQEASQVLDQSSENLVSKVDTIDSATKSASDRLHDMEQMFKKQASDIHLTTDQALLKIESIQAALNDQFQDLSSSVAEAVAQIENVGEQYAKRADQIQSSSSDIVSCYDEAGVVADKQAEKLKALSQTASEEMQQIVAKAQRETKALMEMSATTFTEMKKTSDGFALRAKEVEAQMKQSLKTAHDYGAELGEQSKEMAERTHQNADQISLAISKLAGKMLEVSKAADQVDAKIENSRGKLASETDYLADVAVKAARVVEESAQSYMRQSQSLLKATQDATAQAEKIRQAEKRTQSESFMTSAKFVLESLHSLSIDLSRMMEGDVKEKIWNRYQKGDVAAFTKHLLSIKDQFPLDKMRDKYGNDHEFRTYLNRFVRQFEEVYEQALDNDHGQLLSSIFASSDIGTLYDVLCDIAGRKSMVAA